MLSRPLSIAILLSPTLLLTVGCVQYRSGLEGKTRDTPEQAFEYFRTAVRLDLHAQEYACFSKDFIRRHDGFTLDEYLRGRPLVHGETADLLEALLEAEIVRPPVRLPDGRVRLNLRSGSFRGAVVVVKETYYRIGLADFDAPVEMPLMHTVVVEGDHVLIDLHGDWGAIGGPPVPGELNRIEIADRWYLDDVGEVFEISKTEGEKGSGSERRP
jgi:hypothetical protein